MKEFDLRIPVCRWLISRGLTPMLECYSVGNCDVVGCRFERGPIRVVELVAVELKLNAVAEVLRQCRSHIGRSTETWAAMPDAVAVRNSSRFEEENFGLIGVHDGACRVIWEPFKRDVPLAQFSMLWRRRHQYIWRMADPQMRRFHVTREKRLEIMRTIVA